MPDSYAISTGWDVIAPTNIESIVTDPPHILPDQTMPLMGTVKTRALSGKARRDGALTMRWQWDIMLLTDFRTLVTTIWGDYETASTKVTIITRDASNQYAGFNAYAEQPVAGEDFTVVSGAVYLRDVVLTFSAAVANGGFSLGFSLGHRV